MEKEQVYFLSFQRGGHGLKVVPMEVPAKERFHLLVQVCLMGQNRILHSTALIGTTQEYKCTYHQPRCDSGEGCGALSLCINFGLFGKQNDFLRGFSASETFVLSPGTGL